MDADAKEVVTLLISGVVLIVQEVFIRQKVLDNAKKINQNTDITMATNTQGQETHKCLDETKSLILQIKQEIAEIKQEIQRK